MEGCTHFHYYYRYVNVQVQEESLNQPEELCQKNQKRLGLFEVLVLSHGRNWHILGTGNITVNGSMTLTGSPRDTTSIGHSGSTTTVTTT